jgi:DNA mismatch endonuclease, patch repair protein
MVFPGPRVVVFCDGDFWHGRDLDRRLARLSVGHNAPYWTAKVKANVARDHLQTERLTEGGWLVLRFWESDIHRAPDQVARVVAEAVAERRRGCARRRAKEVANRSPIAR